MINESKFTYDKSFLSIFEPSLLHSHFVIAFMMQALCTSIPHSSQRYPQAFLMTLTISLSPVQGKI
jgi:hypothetical protein